MADSVDGQGVGSAYLELMKLLKEEFIEIMNLSGQHSEEQTMVL